MMSPGAIPSPSQDDYQGGETEGSLNSQANVTQASGPLVCADPFKAPYLSLKSSTSTHTSFTAL